MINPVKTGTIPLKVRRYAKLLFPVFAAALLLMSLIIGVLFFSFQKIALNSLAQQDAEFARQIDMLGNFTDNMIQQYGLQIFYDPVVAGLLDDTDVSDMERVYDMRTLNAYDRSRNFIDSVLIYNKYQEHIYSTDSHLLSAPIDEFPDKSAIELFKNLDVEKRMAPIRRISFPGEKNEKRYFSFLFYETTYIDEPQGSVLMLNVDENWFLDNLTRLYGKDSCVLADENGKLLTEVTPQTEEQLKLFTDDIVSDINSGSNYLVKKYEGQELVCLYSKAKTSGWYYMRIMPMEKCLPGLISLRDGIAVGIGFGFALLVLAVAVTLIYLYLPILKIRKALKDSGSSAEDPENQIDILVQESSEYQNAHTLRNILERRPISNKANIRPPMTLLILEGGNMEAVKELIKKEAPESLIDRQHNCDVLLLTGSDALRGKEICGMLAEKGGYRCFCGIPRNNISELPACYQVLLELRYQQFWYSGQRILLEKDFCCTKHLTDETKERPAEILSALKNRNIQEAETIWAKLLTELQGSGHVEQLVIFHKLAELMEAVLPELKPLVSEEFFKNLKDISELDEKYRSAFKTVVEHYRKQRMNHYTSIVKKAEEIMGREFADPNLSPASLADELDMSSAYLGRIFKETLGCSISQQLNNIRVEKAKKLLRESELSVETIAETVGFSNVKYFYVVFKNICGMTPLQFRKGKNE